MDFPHVCAVLRRGQKRAPATLELELKTVVHCPVGAGN